MRGPVDKGKNGLGGQLRKCPLAQTNVLFILPAIIIMMIITAFPFLNALWMSLQNYVISMPFGRGFVGLKNYATVMSDPKLWSSVKVTMAFAVSVVLIETILGTILALCLLRLGEKRNASGYVSVLIVPMTISPVAVGLIWRMLLHPDLGVINYVLDVVGIGGRAWLGDPSTALGTLIVVDAWQWTPFMMLIIYAALLGLPKEPYEAAHLDGANWFQTFSQITVPLAKPMLLTAILFRFVDALKAYDLVYILTGGGPGTATETLSYYIYKLGFTYLDMGKGSAVSFMFLVVIGVLATFVSNHIGEDGMQGIA